MLSLPLQAALLLGFCCWLKFSEAAEVGTTVAPEVTHGFVADPSANTSIFLKIGDMTVLSTMKGGAREKRNAVANPLFLWPGGLIPYDISPVFTANERRIILQAMKHWEQYTCIRFRPKQSSDVYSIVFISGNFGDCRSFVGRVYNTFLQPQGVTLGPSCIHFPIVVHEIGHAIGFFHEHNRPDRDEHVEVIYSNILRGAESAFAKALPGRTILDYGYDHASIMHYNPDSFSIVHGLDTILPREPGIFVGDAEELSPLDIAKANALYNCGPHDTHPPPMIVVPDGPVVALPPGISCGSVINVNGPGTFRSPSYPSHVTNQECAFVLKAPEGYGFRITFPGFQLDPSSGCTRDYVRLHLGSSTVSHTAILYGGYSGGRICNRQDSRYIFFARHEIITVYYRTDGSNVRSDVRGLEVGYDIEDIDECNIFGEENRCHSCRNLPGSYECQCRAGYYHSYAANTCYDVNECAVDNGGCDQKCTNFGGSYTCSCDRLGFYLQADGLSCGTTRPASSPRDTSPGTPLPRIVTSSKATPSTPTPTTSAPPTTPTTSAPEHLCTGRLTEASGSFSTPNWPLTYPVNINCEWVIELPDPSFVVEISFDDDFGIAGQMPDCEKDQLLIRDGNDKQHGPFCYLTRPDPIRTTSHVVTVTFVAGPQHGPTRHGFKASYRSVQLPTTAPQPTTATPSEATTPTTDAPPKTTPTPTTPTLPPPTTPAPAANTCGDIIRGSSSSGIIKSPNWPDMAYPTNIQCEWTIQCPLATQLIDISFRSSFRVAGQMPACEKDWVEVTDCRGEVYGPYCHLTAPAPLSKLCGAVKVLFYAGSQRGVTRTGFAINHHCVDGPTPPPTTPPTTPTTHSPPTTPTTHSPPTTSTTPTTPTTNPHTTPTMPTTPTTPTTNSPPTTPITNSPPTTPTTNSPSTTSSTQSPTTPTTSPPLTTATTSVPSLCSILTIPTIAVDRNGCAGVISPGMVFGERNLAGNRNCNYILSGIRSGRRYHLRVIYVDFPAGAACSDLSLTAYNGLSTISSPVAGRVCSSADLCSEVVIPISVTGGLGIVRLSKTASVGPIGFTAIFEEA